MQKKLIIALILYVLVISTSLGIVSTITVNEGIEQSLQKRLASAHMIANQFDFLLQSNFNRLYDISLSGKVNLQDNNWERQKSALEEVYQYSLFAEGVFLLDRHGNMLLSYPARHFSGENLMFIPWVSRVLAEGKPIISDVYTLEPIKKPVIFVMVPFRNTEGKIVGVAGGAINPTNSTMSRFLRAVKADSNNSYVEIVDSNEIVVASDNPSRILEHHDHDGTLSRMIRDKEDGIKTCSHGFSQEKPDGKTQDILAVAPLQTVSWAIIFGESKENIFAHSQRLKKKFSLLAVVFIGTAILFSAGIGKNIVSPIRSLIAATNRIARGDLATPVGDIGSDEIAALGTSFDGMRGRLAESAERIRRYSSQLEERVYERTKQLEDRTLQLEDKRKQNERLLKQLITSQEDERKRLARELHDESLQTLSVVLLKIEMCRLHPEQATQKKIEEMGGIVAEIIIGMKKFIQNLRPTVLDDLGFEASIVWLLDRNLKDKGVTCYLNMNDFSDEKLTPQLEISLFRIIQEALINITRHAQARNVFVHIKTDEGTFSMSIEDDGEGFDTASLFKDTLTGRGLGILGMKERAALLNGSLTVCSAPGSGTLLLLRMPLAEV
jgi:signal transduction histidine kinase